MRVGIGWAMGGPPNLAQSVYQQAVVLKLMPLNNATQMTDDERALVRRWYDAGAPGR